MYQRLLLVLLAASTSSAQSQECPDTGEHRLLPHEDCARYYQCEHRHKVVRDCAPGTHFDYQLQICNWPHLVDCRQGKTEPAQPKPISSGLAVPRNDGSKLPNGCPADFGLQLLLPHETECNKFYSCSNGRKYLMSCGAGTVFDVHGQICNWPYLVNCDRSTTTVSTSPEVPITKTTGPPTPSGIVDKPTTVPTNVDHTGPSDGTDKLPNGCPVDYNIQLLVPHEYDCGSFYSCSNGMRILLSCPGGTLFDVKEQICNWPHLVNCPVTTTTSSTTSAPLTTTTSTETPFTTVKDTTISGAPTTTSSSEAPSTNNPTSSSSQKPTTLEQTTKDSFKTTSIVNEDSSTASIPEAITTEIPTSNISDATATESPKTTNSDEASTDSPTTTSPDPVTTESPTTTSTDAVTTDSPETTSTDAVTTDSPTTTSTDAVTTDSPTTTSTDAVTTDSPTTTSTHTVTTDSPTTTSTDAVTKDSPETTSTDAVTTDSPTTTKTDAVTTDSPTTTSTHAVTTDSPTTTSTEDSPTTTSTDEINTNSPTTSSTDAVITDSSTTTSTGEINTDSPTTTSTNAVTSDIPTTTNSDEINTDRPTTSSTDAVTTDSPTTTSTDAVATDSFTSTSPDAVTTDNPTTTSTDAVTTDSPTTTSTDVVHTDSPTTTSTDVVHTDSPTTTSTDAVITDSSTTTSTDVINTDIPSTAEQATTIDSVSTESSNLVSTTKEVESVTSSTEQSLTTDTDGTTVSVPPPPICPPGTFGNVPHPELCNSFYMCAGGNAIQLFCTEGFEFDPELRSCVAISPGGCTLGSMTTWLPDASTDKSTDITQSTTVRPATEADKDETQSTISGIGPTTTSTDAVTTDSPTTTSTGVVHTDSPTTTSTDAVITDSPTTTSTDAVTTYSPTTTSTDVINTDSPSTAEEATTIDSVSTESSNLVSTTKEVESVTSSTEQSLTTETDGTTVSVPPPPICPPGTFGNVPHPELCNSFYMCAGGNAIQLFCTEGFEFDPELRSCVAISPEGCTLGSMTTWLPDASTDKSTDITQSTTVRSTTEADKDETQSTISDIGPTTTSTDAVTTDSPATTSTDVVHTDSPTTTSTDLIHTGSSTTTSTDAVTTDSLTTTSTDVVHTYSPTTTSTDAVTIDSLSTTSTDVINTDSPSTAEEATTIDSVSTESSNLVSTTKQVESVTSSTEQPLTTVTDGTTVSVAPPPICPPGTFGNVPHPELCNSFYMCAGGNAIQLFCTEGFEFDPELRSCVAISPGGCTLGSITTWLPDGSTTLGDSTTDSDLADTTSEDYFTTPSDGNTVTDKTTESLDFVSTNKEVELTTSSLEITSVTDGTTVSVAPPPICPPGTFGNVPHTELCNSFYMCAGGNAVQLFCTEGFEFDPELRSCVAISPGGCTLGSITTWLPDASTDGSTDTTQSVTDEYTTDITDEVDRTTTEISTSTTESLTDITTESSDIISTTKEVELTTVSVGPPPICSPGTIGSVPHPELCNSYYMCSGGNVIQLFCPGGFEFDPKSWSCVPISPGGCTLGSITTSLPEVSTTLGISTTSREQAETELTTIKGSTITETVTDKNTTPFVAATEYLTTEIDRDITQTTIIDIGTTLSDEDIEQTTSRINTESTAVASTESSDVVSTTVIESTTSSTTATVPPPIICAPGTFGNVPHPQLCNSFYMCAGGTAIQLFCTEGFEFDQALRSCTAIAPGGCTLGLITKRTKREARTVSAAAETITGSVLVTPTICPKGTFGNVPHASMCHSFYMCGDDVMTQFYCSQGYEFDLNTKMCELTSASKSRCSNNDNIISNEVEKAVLPLCASGDSGKKPHPQKCNLYYKCLHGKTKEHLCNSGFEFDTNSEECRPISRNGCSSRK